MGIGDIYQQVRAQIDGGEAADKEKNGAGGDLCEVIPAMLAAAAETRETTFSPDMWLGPSTLSGLCPRAFSLGVALGVPLVKQEPVKKKWVMDRGTFLHELLQNWWFGKAKMILGGWKCSRCAHIHGIDPDDKVVVGSSHEKHAIIDKVTVKSAIPMPDKCESCGMVPSWRNGFTYEEPVVYDSMHHVSGHVDGVIVVPTRTELEIMDIKGTTKKALAQLKRRGPYLEHIKQVNWYLDMAKLNKGRVVYVARDEENVTKAFLEKPINYDKKLMNQEKGKLRALREETSKDKPSIPSCPNGGTRPWGPCDCVGLEASI